MSRSRGDRSVIWKGHISFGLVNIPVALLPAESREELDFTLLDRRDRSPIGYQKINKRTGKPVASADIVRGMEQGRGRYVIVSDEDLRRASPERSQRIDIHSFVDLREIDPIYFERPYYLAPLPKQEKGYVLFRETLRRSGLAAIATVVVRTRESPAAIVPQGDVLVLHVLRYPAELRDPDRIDVPGKSPKALGITDKELAVAGRLVEGMTGPFKPEAFRDRYQQDVLAFIRRRARSGKVEASPGPEGAPREGKRGEVVDIMALLEQSLRKRPRGGERPRRRRSA